MSDYNELLERLEAPAYWFSGSADGHEAENDTPYEAATAIRTLLAERQAGWNDAIEAAAKVAEDFEGTASMERCDDPLAAAGCAIADDIRALKQTAIEAGQHLGDSPTSPDDV